MWPASVKMPKWLAVILGIGSFLASVWPQHSNADAAILPILGAALIAGGASLLSSIISGISGNAAANTQADAAQAGIDENRRQFEVMQNALKPYTAAGASSVVAQGDLAGTNGPEAQAAAIAALQNGPEMQAGIQQGENAMLQNAAATGGLRGGNLQGALATFRPQMLSSIIANQYNRLGALSSLGQASAAGVGAGAQGMGYQNAALMGQAGAAQAGGQLAAGQAWNGIPNAVMAGMGTYQGLGGGGGGGYMGFGGPGYTYPGQYMGGGI